MESFPTVQTLAEATTDEVLHHWTGLGYYARARNLHKSAQRVSRELDGKFPSSVADLCELPGIGRSTAGAISAIAFKHPASILDGNVKRVLARFSATEGWPGKAEVLSNLWALAEDYTPKHRIADYTQAIMDLGATVCTRSSPSCTQCPLSNNCLAYHQGNVLKYPGKKPKKTIPVRTCCFLMIKNKAGELMLEQNPSQWPMGVVYGYCPSVKILIKLQRLATHLALGPSSKLHCQLSVILLVISILTINPLR
jgi:A/G-specific adenine glycosylase